MKQTPPNPSCSHWDACSTSLGTPCAPESVLERGRRGERGHSPLAAQRRLPVCVCVFALICVREHVSNTEREKQFAFECMTMHGRS